MQIFCSNEFGNPLQASSMISFATVRPSGDSATTIVALAICSQSSHVSVFTEEEEEEEDEEEEEREFKEASFIVVTAATTLASPAIFPVLTSQALTVWQISNGD